MTEDEQNTARHLINSALGDMAENLTQVETPLDLAKMVAASLRDDHEQRAAINAAAPHALLMAWQIENYGMTNPNDETKHLGGLGVRLLASCPMVEAPLLDQLANTGNAYAYAIAAIVHPDNDEITPGITLLVATRDGWEIAAVAVDDDEKTTDAYQLTETMPVPDTLAATMKKLAAAVQRTGN